MMCPMADFMGEREALATRRAALSDRDNGRVVAADNSRLAAFQPAITNARAEVESDRFKIDLFRLGDPQFL